MYIPFSSLSVGRHEFDFDFDDQILRDRSYDDILTCSGCLHVELQRNERFLELQLRLAGEMSVACDRCLDPVVLPLEHEELLIVTFGDKTDYDDEVWVLSPNEHRLDLSRWVYEALVLHRPFSVVHDLQDCNPEMLKYLGSEACSENTKDQAIEEEDPRWAALKGLR